MWYQQELATYSNETRAALSLFLPLPDGMTAREFDIAARKRRLSGIGRAWENDLFASCRLLATSVPSGGFSETLRHARDLARQADGIKVNALERLDPMQSELQADYIRDDRARRALRRAFGLPEYSVIKAGRKETGAAPQKQRLPNTTIRF